MKTATRLVHFDPAPKDPFRPMATPIYQTATFEQELADSFGEYDYSRSGNPTRRVLEDHVASLEGGVRGFAFSSGMTAIATVTRLLRAGDEIVADWDLYGGASRLFDRVVRRAGITVRLVDGTDNEAVRAAITPATRMLYVESPTNPLLRVLDLRALATVAQDRGVLLCVDSSAMSPYLQNPLALGADIVIHSGTKLLGGHSDVMAGLVVVKHEALAKEIYFLQNAEGTALGPMDCFLLLRGLKTLKLRLDAQQANALRIAQHLQQSFPQSQAAYPGLPDHAAYALQTQQAKGAGVLLTFRAGSPAAAKQIAEGLELFKIAVSFGSVNSSISIPYAMSHASVPMEQRAQRGIPEDLLRVSCGIEDAEDLIADLTTQLTRARA
jgi:cystathionine beta-lyase